MTIRDFFVECLITFLTNWKRMKGKKRARRDEGKRERDFRLSQSLSVIFRVVKGKG